MAINLSKCLTLIVMINQLKTMIKNMQICILWVALLLVFVLNAQTPQMIEVPAGSFLMGCDSLGYTEHEVTLTHDFEMSKYEITASEFCATLNFAFSENELLIIPNESVMNVLGDQQELIDLDASICQIEFDGNEFEVIAGMEEFPVVEITWFGAAFYCNMLSRMNAEDELYDMETWNCEPYSENGYRLPTEAEWEFSARYNDGRIYPWGNDSPDSTRVNCFGMGNSGLATVGSFSPNGDSSLGFCDLSGNVWEWCNDWFEDYSSDPQVDPTGPETGTRISIRGAGWMSPIQQLPSAFRSSNYKDHSYYDFGFRIVYLPEQTSSEPQMESNRLKCRVYPNPFNPSTTISFETTNLHELPQIEIYNLKGQKIKTLDCHLEFIEGYGNCELKNPHTSTALRMTQAGSNQYSVGWDGTNDSGKPVSSGVYFYKIKSGYTQFQGKLLLLK
jgi:formylglycine-generating enzyme required for sulfatase activity